MQNGNLKLAIQKKGRLTEKSLDLLRRCGIEIETYSDRLFVTARNYSLDLLFLRDDDIPEYVQDGVADLGIVGEDVLFEKQTDTSIVKKLNYGRCRLMIAIPEKDELKEIKDLDGKRIATSHPVILKDFLSKNSIDAKTIDINGSVEIAPSLGVADYICDIVSTGNTLKLNKLKKSFTVFESEAVLIANNSLHSNPEKKNLLRDLLRRLDSVQTAKNSKYLMMNIPKKSLNKISEIIPSIKSPTVLHLLDKDQLAVHAVIPSERFWEVIDDLKKEGATGILLMPIENMIP